MQKEIVKAFSKEDTDLRKTWIVNYDPKKIIDVNAGTITCKEFIDEELIHFSSYDVFRSLASSVDGLKISQRKILYSAFKKKLAKEIKVAQFTGYVSEHSGYHHGEESLNGAIIKMASEYVGSLNLNLFVGNGQFGDRLDGGKNNASPRYIFTHLNLP